ncbi:MAG: Mrp/NBP35 family ATP-binding protein [Rikenellaceae bacterium]
MEQKINTLLRQIIHPETGVDIVEGGFVEGVVATDKKIVVTLRFGRVRDPFAIKIKGRIETMLAENFANFEGTKLVLVKEAAPKKIVEPEKKTTTSAIANVIGVASGKGGVGKSTVTANLAATLRDMGFRVGILDADIYGPSQPRMWGVEGYLPDGEQVDGVDCIIPAEVDGLKVMSIGFFIKPTDALLWRGTMASNALKQLIHQTKWGTLDFLLVDLPPGTGDIHLTILSELKFKSAVIVSTPQGIALADVVRGVEMFHNENVKVKVAGIIENMAWFTPEELPDNRYYIFGRGGAREYASQVGVPFLGEVPIIQSIMEGAEAGTPAIIGDERVKEYYAAIAESVIRNTLA